MSDLVVSQLTDIFRIGLIIGLVYTMRRTAAVTGRILPLFLGVLFVAVIVPSTLPHGAATLVDAMVAGLISNSIILAAVLAVTWLVARLRA